MLIVDLQENIYKQVEKIDDPSTGFAGRRIVDLGDLSIDIFLEVQNEKYSRILYLTDYIAYGTQSPHKFWNSPKSAKILKCVIITPDLIPRGPLLTSEPYFNL